MFWIKFNGNRIEKSKISVAYKSLDPGSPVAEMQFHGVMLVQAPLFLLCTLVCSFHPQGHLMVQVG